MIYKFLLVGYNKAVEIYFINEEDALAHAKRLASVNGDVAVYLLDKQIAYISAL